MSTSMFLFADAASRITFELGRDLSTPVSWIAPAVVMLVLVWFVVGMYLLDCVELGGRFATLLIGIRILAFVGILAVYLQPQWRTTRDVVNNSRMLVLADTSQSMGRRDVAADDANSAGGVEPRIDRVVRELAEGQLIPELRQVHDVMVYRFDQDDKPTPVASFAKLAPADGASAMTAEQIAALQSGVQQVRQRLALAGGVLLFALVCFIWFLIRPAATGKTGPGPLVVAALAVIACLGVCIWTFTDAPEMSFRQLAGLDPIVAERPHDQSAAAAVTETGGPAEPKIDWPEALAARGAETKLGQAVYQLVLDERATPLSAIVVFSDGQRTSGIEIEDAAKAAAEAEVPVYTVGLGSLELPAFVRLADFAVPARAYQDDPFEVTAYVQSQGLAGRGAIVTLNQVTADSQQNVADTGLAYETETTLGEDREELVPVVFDVEGFDEPGRYAFELNVALKGGGKREDDNRRRFYIDVVDRQTKVLLVAGGPSREYQFLRALLVRDKNVDVDVLLQTKRFEAVDDPDYLQDFPQTIDELSKYDAIVGIDPDWVEIGASAATMMENWVAEEAGGMVVIPGHVNAGSIVRSWAWNEDFKPLWDLYPVVFFDRNQQLADRPAGSKTAWPIEFTRAGMEADFLRLSDNPIESQRIWAGFEGIYGGFPIKDKKLGATVYAYYGDTEAEAAGYEPIMMAGHFYGRGRVFYLGSGEMWRLRTLDEAYFEQFYTRLIRHVTMGRLHRGSTRGDVLLLEKEQYSVGDTVPVVAHLKNAQREPYVADSVTLYVLDTKNEGPAVQLTKDPARPGAFRGEFVVRTAQDYRLELPLPESDDEPLSKVIKVTESEREKKNPQQDDKSLKLLAEKSSGRYYASVESALGAGGEPPLVPSLVDQSRTTPIAGEIDPLFKQAWSQWMMFAICGILCFEWLLRRLFKLA